MTATTNEQQVTQPLPSIAPDAIPAGKTEPMTDDAFASDMPPLKVSAPLNISNQISSNTRQLIVFVSDVSSSMAGSKIAELNQARKSFITEIADPANKDGFRVAFVDFSHRAYLKHDFVSAIGLELPVAVVRHQVI